MNLREIKDIVRTAIPSFERYNFTVSFVIKGDLPPFCAEGGQVTPAQSQSFYDSMRDKKISLKFAFMAADGPLWIDLDITVEELMFFVMSYTGAHCRMKLSYKSGTSTTGEFVLPLGPTTFKLASTEDKAATQFLNKVGIFIGESSTAGIKGRVPASVPLFKLYRAVVEKMGVSGQLKRYLLRNFWRSYRIGPVTISTDQSYGQATEVGRPSGNPVLQCFPETTTLGTVSEINAWFGYTNTTQNATNSDEQLGSESLDELGETALRVKADPIIQGQTFVPLNGDTYLVFPRPDVRRNELPRVIVTHAKFGQ